MNFNEMKDFPKLCWISKQLLICHLFIKECDVSLLYLTFIFQGEPGTRGFPGSPGVEGPKVSPMFSLLSEDMLVIMLL